ncbi:hypothetical protein V6O07_03985, partial [Arthrospira platensis SPKY2]
MDITSITPLILEAQDPTVFTVDYYLSEQEAIAQQNALTAAQAANFVTGSTTLWAQVSNNVNSCTDRTPIAIIIHALPEFTFNDPSVVCVDFITGAVLSPSFIDSGLDGSLYSFEWRNDSGAIVGTEFFYEATAAGTYTLQVT